MAEPNANNYALFAQTQRSDGGLVTAANPIATPAVANLALVWTSGALGSLLSSVRCRPRATISDAQIQLYGSTDNGVTLRLIDTAKLSAWTSATTTDASKGDFGYTPDLPLRTRPNEKIYAGSAVALSGGIDFRTEGGDL